MKKNDLIIIDVEASGLEDDSYPIEIGLYSNNFSYSSLIIPDENWVYWDSYAENIHNIDREKLFLEGKKIEIVAIELNEILNNKKVYSDAVDWDSFWIDKLFNNVSIYRNFKINSVYNLSRNIKKEQFISTRRRLFLEEAIKGNKQHRVDIDTKVIHRAAIETYF